MKMYGTVIVLVHAVVASAHGIAHLAIPVPLSLLSSLFVVTVIGLMPFIAVRLLWSAYTRIGMWLLLVSMLAALIFGLYNHFINVSPDHVSHVPDHEATPIFQVTAYTIMALEAIGVAIGFRGASQRQPVEV